MKAARRKPKSDKKRWDAIIQKVGRVGKIIGAEVGVEQGKTSAKLLHAMPGLHLFLVDRWCVTPEGDTYFKGSNKMSRYDAKTWVDVEKKARAAVAPYKGRYTIMKMETTEAAKYVDDGSLDFVFIDADHSYEGVTKDIKAWRSKVKRGGWLIGHDYNSSWPGCVKAVHEQLGKDNVTKSYNSTWFYKVK